MEDSGRIALSGSDSVHRITYFHCDSIMNFIEGGVNIIWSTSIPIMIRPEHNPIVFDYHDPESVLEVHAKSDHTLVKQIIDKGVKVKLRYNGIPGTITDAENYIANVGIPVKLDISYSFLLSYLKWKHIPYTITKIDDIHIEPFMFEELANCTSKVLDKLVDLAISEANEELLLAIRDMGHVYNDGESKIFGHWSQYPDSITLMAKHADYLKLDRKPLLIQAYSKYANIKALSCYLHHLTLGDIIDIDNPAIIHELHHQGLPIPSLDDIIDCEYSSSWNISLMLAIVEYNSSITRTNILKLIRHWDDVGVIILELHKRNLIDLQPYAGNSNIQRLLACTPGTMTKNAATKIKIGNT